ncbi:3-deoxy-7-phosphoheptulonate synthase [Nocardiopsis kunsanensis]|uniref:Phospho-2-dehydro-3-deoxyheptonate aldolase n=1 Tax=Nocardiopsis kunsanensis TaxID=141693 RepID=A0A919CL19_9ACTN|nr:3-deoxy-7-phosphoheptulonate synthase [Nocardiopsis kunsanensis]GHD35662.1 phospho-2-dehydro-3-deoxyheptonate aldolase [Nocardiopsis kunsanensis]
MGVTRSTLAEQQPQWPDPHALAKVKEELGNLPELVTEEEIEALSVNLRAVARGESLLLHGGDCMEPFTDSGLDRVTLKVGQLSDLSTLMRAGSGMPRVTVIGRIAGQHAKPRSQEYDWSPDGTRMPVYRGDAVNRPTPDRRLREADAGRMLESYRHSALALSALRQSWSGKPKHDRVFASHELLLLPYERALFRKGERGSYATSAHFGWVGERTRSLDGSHMDFSASVHNPIGVKLGYGVTPAELVSLVEKLNPERLEGRLTLISRMGVRNIELVLPDLVRAVRESGVPVIWICDPMHGNTYRSTSGEKTRSVPDIQEEADSFVRVLRAGGVQPAGLSLEVTPDQVTECVWSSGQERFPRYQSACDPRLDPQQAAAVVEAFTENL